MKVICLTAIGAPGIFAATQGLTVSPEAAAVMALLSLAAGYMLSELDPGWRGTAASLTPEQRAQIVSDLKAEMTRDPEGRLAAPRAPRRTAPHG